MSDDTDKVSAEILQIGDFTKKALRGRGGDGDDGGMPPEDLDKLKERVSRIETKVDALLPAVTALGDKIDKLGDKIAGLAERVATVEGQLKQIPTLWTVLVGQIAAAVAVAGIIVAAFNFGLNSSPKPATTTPQVDSPDKGTRSSPRQVPSAG